MLRRIARRAAAPLRRDTDRLNDHLTHLIHAIKNDLAAQINHVDVRTAAIHESLTDQYSLVSTRIAHFEERLNAGGRSMDEQLRSLEHRVGQIAPSLAPTVRLRDLADARLADIDGLAANFLNHCYSADGPLREAGYFVNDPLTVLWHEGEVRLEQVNERIAEIPFVYRALADLDPPASILDVGGGESTLGLALASVGHAVTVCEPRGYPFEHPNLRVEAKPVEEIASSTPFDVAILLSTIEHIGIGAYELAENPDVDIDAMQTVTRLVRPGGRLVLTTPFGTRPPTALERTYDLGRLERLLTGWTIDHTQLVTSTDRMVWQVDDTPLDEASERAEPDQVIMLVATRTAD